MNEPTIKKTHRKGISSKKIKKNTPWRREALEENEAKKTTAHTKGTETSWGGVADWYKETVAGSDSYQAQVIAPELFRNLRLQKGMRVLDLACGEGYFARLCREAGATVTGTDISPELIALAKKEQSASGKNIDFFVSPSHDMRQVADASIDIIICVLAIQNIELVKQTFAECARVLSKGGRFMLVLNHPSFRNPQKTDWGYDEGRGLQYRRTDEYMSESKVKIDMTPGERNPYKKDFTVSFHRPLQFFIKQLAGAGFAVTGLEEWVSHKTSEAGPKQQAENKARHEIPLFMFINAVVLNK